MATIIDPNTTTVVDPDPVLIDSPIVTTERARISSPFGWSAIFAGVAVTLGSWLVLHLIGIGVGMIAVNPNDAGSLKGVGIGAGVWSLAAPIAALFLGGLVAGRVAPTINSGVAAIHGAVLWGVTMLAGFMVVMSLLGSLARGAGAAAGAVGDVAGAAAKQAGNVSLDDLGIREEDLVARINTELKAQGKPPVTAEQIKAVAKDTARSTAQTGQFDRAAVLASIQRHTELSGTDAEQLATQFEANVAKAKAKVSDTAEKGKHKALEVVEGTGKALLVISLATLLGLGAAIGGAVASVRHERREHVVLPRASTR